VTGNRPWVRIPPTPPNKDRYFDTKGIEVTVFYFVQKTTLNNESSQYRYKKSDVQPEEYRFVFKKIQSHMWQFAAGAGYDMRKIHYDLIALFEAGTAEGKSVLEVTDENVAEFCDELLRSAKTYTGDLRGR